LLIQENNSSASFNFGVSLVKKACEAPFRKLIQNKLNRDPGILLEKVLASKNLGFDC
jgi:chaperonin GroEL (HSP60 family)